MRERRSRREGKNSYQRENAPPPLPHQPLLTHVGRVWLLSLLLDPVRLSPPVSVQWQHPCQLRHMRCTRLPMRLRAVFLEQALRVLGMFSCSGCQKTSRILHCAQPMCEALFSRHQKHPRPRYGSACFSVISKQSAASASISAR